TISWPAVWAGTFTAFASLLILTALGVAIGFSVLQADPLAIHASRGWTIGTAAWSYGSMLVALFIGGAVAPSTRLFITRPSFVVSGTLVWMLVLLGTLALGVVQLGAGGEPGASAAMDHAAVSSTLERAAPGLAGALDSRDVGAILARLNDPAT